MTMLCPPIRRRLATYVASPASLESRLVGIERLLWFVALTYALAPLLLWDPRERSLRVRSRVLLKRLAALGRRSIVGKLAKALALDHGSHAQTWTVLGL